jgi:hypothetical protein
MLIVVDESGSAEDEERHQRSSGIDIPAEWSSRQ